MNRAGIILVLFSLLVIGASWHYWIQAMAEMRAELEVLRVENARAAREYDLAMAAASSALRAREMVNAETMERMARLENIIADADSMCIPDGLREFFAGAGAKGDTASGPAAHAHSDP